MVYIGEIMQHGVRYRVSAVLQDGALHLHRQPVDGPYAREECDWPITLITREGLLRLSQGPFEDGYVEDHL